MIFQKSNKTELTQFYKHKLYKIDLILCLKNPNRIYLFRFYNKEKWRIHTIRTMDRLFFENILHSNNKLILSTIIFISL